MIEILETAPPISREARFYWDQYGVLVSDRPSSMGGMPRLPISSILRWAEYLDLTHIETEWFVRIIRHVDAHHCRIVDQKSSDKAAKARAKG